MGDDRSSYPLGGVRIVDITDGLGAMCTRFLADLGADVVLVEPVGGVRARTQPPVVEGVSLPFLAHSANKRVTVIDWESPAGALELLDLIARADIVVESQRPGRMSAAGVGADTLRRLDPGLVVTSITEFGQTGPYRHWLGTEWVHLALSSVLSRSGRPGQPPLMPPGRLPSEHVAAQAAWVTLVAYWSALESGIGDHIDLSAFEATAQSMDAAFGIGGSAMGGVPASDLPPGRPDASFMYPIFPCADGHVRICLLARRQWQAMFGWLGEPTEFADPKYDLNHKRFAARDQLYPLIGALFADRSHADLVADGQRRGVPIESVNRPSDVLTDPHFQARGSWTDITLPSARVGRLPHGFLEVDGQRLGYRAPISPAGATPFDDSERGKPAANRTSPSSTLGPLAGLRVLDLGVIVVGAETGRLFADLGADVIKVESSAFPDGSRAASRPGTVSATFASGHRNKRSLGVDLRSPQGRELFIRLAAQADVVLSNFKPGTMDSLGIGYEQLSQVNPGIVMVDSSALGSSGPSSRRMGYGPLVRAGAGLTSLWSYPDQPEGFCDSITIYPDHTAARIGAAAALAALIARRASGRGATISVAQAEVMLAQFAPEFLRESFEPGTMKAIGNRGEFDAPCGVFACAGEDQWCVVTVANDDQWRRLCGAIGAETLAADDDLATPAGRIARVDELEHTVTAWTRRRSPDEVMTTLQDAGVPAASMLRVNDLLSDRHLVARNFFATLHQPGLGDLPVEGLPAHFDNVPNRVLRPAPLQGEHTREVMRTLGVDETEIDRLIDAGVLEEPPASATK